MSAIAHIVNPVAGSGPGNLVVAQMVTFESMRTAHDFAGSRVRVSLLATQLLGEERVALPAPFERTPDLTRTVSDLTTFRRPRPLPLIGDILDRLRSSAPWADYLVYSNADIALQPHFYLTVARLAGEGYDAFAINRRTISARWHEPADLPLMWAEVGEPHPGWDCFVFHRQLLAHFDLGQACIGADWIGRIMITNMATFARRFRVFDDLHLTFHLGDERAWQGDEYSDHAEYNRRQCRTVLERFERQHGPFPRDGYPGRFFGHLESARRQSRPGKIFSGLILVGGAPRSGTTFLARTLGRHPQVATPIDNHVYECLALYDYAHRSGLVAELRAHPDADPAALRRALRQGLVRDGALSVAPSSKSSGCAVVATPGADRGETPPSLQDETLVRHRIPLERLQGGWRLCLKSPEITFVLPRMAALFPHALFVLVYRPVAEIAASMFRLGNVVRRFPVYHARWRLEAGPPPGLPPAWTDRWRSADDYERCILYAAAYLDALADGADRLGPGRSFLYSHADLRQRPQQTLRAIAHFLGLDSQPLEVAAVEVYREPPADDPAWPLRGARLAKELGVDAIATRLGERSGVPR